MQIVSFCDHADQFIAENKGYDHACNRHNDGLRQSLNHGKDAAVPSLRCLTDLLCYRSGLLVYIGEHGSKIARYEGGQKLS